MVEVLAVERVERIFSVLPPPLPPMVRFCMLPPLPTDCHVPPLSTDVSTLMVAALSDASQLTTVPAMVVMASKACAGDTHVPESAVMTPKLSNCWLSDELLPSRLRNAI